MSDTLLDLAKTNLNVAKKLYSMKDDDDRMLNIVAYHLQQFFELFLKHGLELSGVKYPKTHDIMSLLELMPEGKFDILLPWCGTITEMESKTRYVKNYRMSQRIIEQLLPIADALLKEATINKSSVFGE